MPNLEVQVVRLSITDGHGRVLESTFVGKLSESQARLANRLIAYISDRYELADSEEELKQLFAEGEEP